MIPIATLLRFPDGKHVFHNGVLYPVPPEMRGQSRIRHYLTEARPGWRDDDLGYQIFGKELRNGAFLILPALELLNTPRARRKFPGFVPVLTRMQVEALANSFVPIYDISEDSMRDRARILVHDLRGISNTLYHNAEAAMDLLSQGDEVEASKRLRTVIAAQGVLRIRIDAIDFEGNLQNIASEPVSIYRKVDKVSRCFKELATLHEKSVFFGGYSDKRGFGPDIFELVPYAIIDNAVKYCPKGSRVEVTVQDTLGIQMVVTSLGPKIRRSEEESIFEKGFRGESAGRYNLPGSGLGLHMAKRIVAEMFGGTIYVQQSNTMNYIDGLEYFETTFTVNLPSSG